MIDSSCRRACAWLAFADHRPRGLWRVAFGEHVRCCSNTLFICLRFLDVKIVKMLQSIAILAKEPFLVRGVTVPD